MTPDDLTAEEKKALTGGLRYTAACAFAECQKPQTEGKFFGDANLVFRLCKLIAHDRIKLCEIHKALNK